MLNTWNRTLFLLLSLVLLNGCIGMCTVPTSTTAPAARAGCNDYSILANSADRAKFEQHCGSNDETDRLALLAVLSRLNPVNEASAAARRGDFRLAAVIGGGLPAPGQHRFWTVDGVDCEILNDIDVAIWLGMSDAFYSATHGQLQGSMRRFATAYNVALVVQQGFPTTLGCKLRKRLNKGG